MTLVVRSFLHGAGKAEGAEQLRQILRQFLQVKDTRRPSESGRPGKPLALLVGPWPDRSLGLGSLPGHSLASGPLQDAAHLMHPAALTGHPRVDVCRGRRQSIANHRDDDNNGVVSTGGTLLAAAGTATSGYPFSSNPLDLVASSFNGTNAVNQDFRWQAEGNGSANTGSLNLVYASGSGAPAETGLSINENGLVSFAPNQTFAASQLPVASASSEGVLQLTKDLAGSAAAPLVTGLQGHPVSIAAPTANQVLSWNGAAWAPTSMMVVGQQCSQGSAVTGFDSLGNLICTPIGGSGGVIAGSTDPTGSCIDGKLAVNSSAQTFFFCAGSQWIPVVVSIQFDANPVLARKIVMAADQVCPRLNLARQWLLHVI